MKQNTEQLKKEFNRKFLQQEENGGEYWDWFDKTIKPSEIWNFFLPHLISSDEIKRESLEGLIKFAEDDFRKTEARYNARGEFVSLDYSPNIWLKKLIKEYLTQSKEGGE